MRGPGLHNAARAAFGRRGHGDVHCIRNGTTIESRTITTSGSDASAWYYDGPGYTAQVCVTNGSTGAHSCGPLN